MAGHLPSSREANGAPSKVEGLPSGLSLRLSRSAELKSAASGSKTWQASHHSADFRRVEWCPEPRRGTVDSRGNHSWEWFPPLAHGKPPDSSSVVRGDL